MRSKILLFAAVVASLLAVSGSAEAHHSWQLDRSKVVNLKGTVTKFDFANPHVQVYLDVKGENGAAEMWTVGGPSPNQLSRTGWSRETMKPGDQVTVDGYRNRDGSKVLRFDTITLATGQVMVGYRGR